MPTLDLQPFARALALLQNVPPNTEPWLKNGCNLRPSNTGGQRDFGVECWIDGELDARATIANAASRVGAFQDALSNPPIARQDGYSDSEDGKDAAMRPWGWPARTDKYPWDDKKGTTWWDVPEMLLPPPTPNEAPREYVTPVETAPSERVVRVHVAGHDAEHLSLKHLAALCKMPGQFTIVVPNPDMLKDPKASPNPTVKMDASQVAQILLGTLVSSAIGWLKTGYYGVGPTQAVRADRMVARLIDAVMDAKAVSRVSPQDEAVFNQWMLELVVPWYLDQTHPPIVLQMGYTKPAIDANGNGWGPAVDGAKDQLGLIWQTGLLLRSLFRIVGMLSPGDSRLRMLNNIVQRQMQMLVTATDEKGYPHAGITWPKWYSFKEGDFARDLRAATFHHEMYSHQPNDYGAWCYNAMCWAARAGIPTAAEKRQLIWERYKDKADARQWLWNEFNTCDAVNLTGKDPVVDASKVGRRIILPS